MQRRTFAQTVLSLFSSCGLLRRKADAQPIPNPDGWTITWEAIESDKVLGYWVATPQSPDRDAAFRALVKRPQGKATHSDLRQIEVAQGLTDDVIMSYPNRLRRRVGEDYDADDYFIKGCEYNYFTWDTEYAPPSDEQLESAKMDGHSRVLSMIHAFRKEGSGVCQSLLCVGADGERVRVKPEGYLETAPPTEDARRIDAARQAFDNNPPAFWALMVSTFADLWHYNDYPKTVVCGKDAWESMMGYYRTRVDSRTHRFIAADLSMDESMPPRQVRFINDEYPDAKSYNRTIEMPDETSA